MQDRRIIFFVLGVLVFQGTAAGFSENFEDGMLGDFTSRDGSFGIEGSPSIGSYSIGANTGHPSATLATATPAEWSGGVRISKFEYSWYETSSSYGGGVGLYDSDGNIVAGMITDNPQWYIYDGCNGWNYLENTGQYGEWTDVTFNFNWESGTYDYTINSPSGYNSGTASLCSGKDIEQIKIRDANQPSGTDWNTASNQFYMWFDEFSAPSVNTAPEAPSNPKPTDGNSSVVLKPEISAEFNDPDGESGTLAYYTGSGNPIGSCTVSEGSRCNVTYSNADQPQTIYSWYSVASDGSTTTQSNTWNFTPDHEICDRRGTEKECISSEKHFISGKMFPINSILEIEEDAVLKAIKGQAKIDNSNKTILSGIYHGSFNISTKYATIKPGAEFRPENGSIIIGN